MVWGGLCVAEDTAFRSLFNGENLEGWDGDDRFWRVENGEIIGETTDKVKAEDNTFLIYRPAEFGDFELRFQYQVRGYNSGVQYRSVDAGNYVVTGLQSDFEDRWHKDGERTVDKFSGMFFEERGRMFLGQRGDVVMVQADSGDPQKHVVKKIGSVGDPQELEKAIHRDGWNEMTVIAEGNTFVHIINGRVMSIGVDEHKEKRRDKGIIAFQLHKGPPMQIRLKDVRVRELD
jgi:hypothetical protein